VYIVIFYINGKKIYVGKSRDLQEAINVREEAEIVKNENE
jgi:hypothetical protein